jgi:hypothetical protein
MNNIRRLNATGLEHFSTHLADGASEPAPQEWLTNDQYSEEIPEKWEIDLSKSFADRFEFAQYAWNIIKADWRPEYEHDVGLWTWLALAYFEQFRAKGKLSHEEHYIYDSHRHAYYRHCAAMPIKLVRDFGADARIFLSKEMSTMGDMLEQCMSRQYLVRSKTFRLVVRKLYFDETQQQLKSGASSNPAKRKLANGKWSKAGAGSVRRLALEIKRLELAFNLQAMQPDEVIALLGTEYGKFKSEIETEEAA